MGIFNPVYALVIPSLALITIPLAILAGITTTLAFSVLILRVLVVYLDLALSLVPGFTSTSSAAAQHHHRRLPSSSLYSPTLTLKDSSPPPRRHQTPQHHRRRLSSASARSHGSATSMTSDRGLGLVPGIGPERDFEGIGGWRVGGMEDDELWTTVNPRMEGGTQTLGAGGRHHHRTPSGPTTPGEGSYLVMKGRTRSPEATMNGHSRTASCASPNSSRARTPTAPKITLTGMAQGDGYFALSRNTSPKATKR